MIRIEDFTRLMAFVKVVDHTSFSAAARELGTTKSTVSKYVSELEAHFGVKLLHRTTRCVTTTDVGNVLYQRCRGLWDDAQEAAQAVLDQRAEPRGTLRLACPSAFGRLYIMPVLSRFLQRWPKVRAEIVAVDRDMDLVAERIDIAIRLAPPADSSLLMRRLGASRRCICAAPAYLARHGIPRTPEDLSEHDCLVLGKSGQRAFWQLVGADGPVKAPVRARVWSEDPEELNALMVAGLGIGYPPEFAAAEHLRAGTLIPLLEPWCQATVPIVLVCPPGRNDDPKVRYLIDFLADELGNAAPWDPRQPAPARMS